jgi:hypothetical protein
VKPSTHSRTIDHRKHPEKYRVAKGEQGVLTVEPDKSEILPLWKFRTPEDAKRSSEAILELFRRYVREDDFVGMDMARKFLQMGYTRARRYANHRTGKKYIGPVPKATAAMGARSLRLILIRLRRSRRRSSRWRGKKPKPFGSTRG